MTPSSSSKVSLANVSLVTSGSFTCVVTGGDIPFQEDYDTKYVTVAGEEKLKDYKKCEKLFISSTMQEARDRRSPCTFLSRRFSQSELHNTECGLKLDY